MRDMLNAAWWAGAAASTLVLGAWLGARFHSSPKIVGLVMGFGAGALIASVSFELTEEAFNAQGTATLALGLAVGALTYFVGDLLIDRMGGDKRMHAGGETGNASLALFLGATLDAIPESLIIGLSLTGGSPSLAFFVSVAVSNVPEGFASASGQEHQGKMWPILRRWVGIVIVSAIFGALGYVLLDDPSTKGVAFTQAFGAGALLTMVMDTMAPEAYRDAGPLTGLIAVAGFAFAFLLGRVD
jgi:zinc transporter, ZIP family